MKKIFSIVLCALVATAWPKSVCDQKVPQIVDMYQQNDVELSNVELYDCSTLAPAMGAVFDEVTDTDAPQVLGTEACIVILRVAQDSLDEIAVFDPANDFELVRSFGNPKEGFASSRLGDRYDGTILFIKHDIGKHPDNWKYITRVNFDQQNGIARLYRWKLGLFTNKYTHDYTVQCLREH